MNMNDEIKEKAVAFLVTAMTEKKRSVLRSVKLGLAPVLASLDLDGPDTLSVEAVFNYVQFTLTTWLELFEQLRQEETAEVVSKIVDKLQEISAERLDEAKRTAWIAGTKNETG